jgi:hypothetical protein
VSSNLPVGSVLVPTTDRVTIELVAVARTVYVVFLAKNMDVCLYITLQYLSLTHRDQIIEMSSV